MPCYYPMQAYRGKELTKKGKRKPVFNRSAAFWPELSHNQLTLPCGQCIGCRLERSRQWAVRCTHEASLYRDNCFITLTYNDESLDKYCPDMSLNVKHFQNFMKRLRKYEADKVYKSLVARFIGLFSKKLLRKYSYMKTPKIRFYHCGEYGDKFRRPHYHAILFNYDFPDKKLWKEENGVKLYRSALLEKLWPFGYCSVGAATFESAAYVARYIMKKNFGKDSEDHYKNFDCDTGLIYDLRPEYTTMSRRPGIARGWYEKYKDDVFPRDEVVLRNKKMRPPKYYDSLYELTNSKDYERIKLRRKESALKHKDNQTPERLAVREKVKLSQVSRLVRSVD